VKLSLKKQERQELKFAKLKVRQLEKLWSETRMHAMTVANQATAWAKRGQALEELGKNAVEVIKDFAEHDSDCAAGQSVVNDEKCDCGLTALLAGITEILIKPLSEYYEPTPTKEVTDAVPSEADAAGLRDPGGDGPGADVVAQILGQLSQQDPAPDPAPSGAPGEVQGQAGAL